MSVFEGAERVHAREVTVPAATLEASPLVQDLSFTRGILLALDLLIPPGHGGTTGLALYQSGRQVIPSDEGDWLKGDGSEFRMGLEGYHETGLWSARAFNTDVFEHTFYMRFLVRELELGPEPGLPDLVARL